MADHVYYTPSEGVAADVIPFWEDGEHHLFYLRDFRDRAVHGEGTPWFHISTRDLVTFVEHGECLGRGTPEEQDLYAFTGCVLRGADAYHIFYTGSNPHFRGVRPRQAVMHAVSDNMRSWTKLPDDTLFAPAGYDPDDWRDPYVFFNKEVGKWWMLLAARFDHGPSRRRGCVALLASEDLRTWEVREPLYAPSQFFTHECPDLFSMGDWWYLVFSEFSDSCVTRYRMARSAGGPWLTPPVDTFDTRALYAAKTASDNGQRVLFGWNPTREGETDSGRWQWGGSIVPHELVQARDGTLGVRLPHQIAKSFCRRADMAPENDRMELATEGFTARQVGVLPHTCLLEVTADMSPGTRAFGLALRSSADLDTGYQIRVEPTRSRIVLDAWPREGDVPYMVGLERPLSLSPGQPLRFSIVLDGTVCEIYTDSGVALSARLYDHRTDHWGLFVAEGAVTWSDLRIHERT